MTSLIFRFFFYFSSSVLGGVEPKRFFPGYDCNNALIVLSRHCSLRNNKQKQNLGSHIAAPRVLEATALVLPEQMCRGGCHGYRRGGAARRLQHSLTQWSLILSPRVSVEMGGGGGWVSAGVIHQTDSDVLVGVRFLFVYVMQIILHLTCKMEYFPAVHNVHTGFMVWSSTRVALRSKNIRLIYFFSVANIMKIFRCSCCKEPTDHFYQWKAKLESDCTVSDSNGPVGFVGPTSPGL